VLLTLSESFSDTLSLDTTQVDFSLSEAILESHPQEAPALFETMTQKMPRLWQELVRLIEDNPWIQLYDKDNTRTLGFSVVLVSNAEIQCLNREFRGKDHATDVLTFTLIEEIPLASELDQLPEVNLGEIYLSMDWARDTICLQMAENQHQTINFFSSLTLFLLERLVHGCLHILGVHHDTMSDYNKVVAIQETICHALAE
jgi:probable rRNA maturation factor